jgi:hypothetical protein
VKGAVSGVASFVKDAGNAIGGWFSKTFGRKKRSACVPPVIPTLNVDVNGIQGKIPDCKKLQFANSAPCQLLAFAKKLKLTRYSENSIYCFLDFTFNFHRKIMKIKSKI